MENVKCEWWYDKEAMIRKIPDFGQYLDKKKILNVYGDERWHNVVKGEQGTAKIKRGRENAERYTGL